MDNQNVGENIYKATVGNTPLCLKVFDPEGKLIFINKAGLAEHGLKETDNLAEFDWLKTIEKEYLNAVRNTFAEALQGKSGDVIFAHSFKGANREWCHGVFSPLQDEEGKNLGIVFYSLDMTELKKKIEEIENANKYMVERELKMIELKKRIAELEGGQEKI